MHSSKSQYLIGRPHIVLILSLLCIYSTWPNQISSVATLMVEICDNAEDDDGDGLVDLNDADCICMVIEPTSLIPNPSFEDMNCCPGTRSQLDCAEVWIQASEPTTDYINTCGWLGWDNFPAPFPFPDGEGIMGFRDGRVIQDTPEKNWKEYAGACLLGPLKAGTPYRFEFHVGFVDQTSSPLINISFFGTSDCMNLPFGVGDDAFGCPTNGPGWVRLGSRRVAGGSGTWVKTTIDVNPLNDITAIAIGPDCPGTSSSVSTYYFFDNLVLADLRSFEFQIKEIGHSCAEDFLLEVPEEPQVTYQWYKDGIALLAEKSPQLTQMYGEGDYQVRILGDESCHLTKSYTHMIPVISESFKLTICEDDVYNFGPNALNASGTYVDTFKTADNCDSIVQLNLKVLGPQSDFTSAKIFEGETYTIGNYRFQNAGSHLALLESKLGCDSLVNLELDYYNVYFPNIFSPNGDGQNDRFNVYGNDDLIEIKDLVVFDRWGKTVYKSTDLYENDNKGWDGRNSGNLVELGIYTFLCKVFMDDGKERQFSGTVMLVR